MNAAPVDKAPVTVTVTGASGQIAYGLLFRIAAGDMLGPDTPSGCDCSRSRRQSAPRRASRWNSRTGVPAAERRRDHRRPRRRLRRCERRAARRCPASHEGHGARRPARRERRDLHDAGTSDRGRGCRRRQGPRRGQPRQHQCPHRDEQCARCATHPFSALTRLDHNRAIAQLAHRTGEPAASIRRMSIWGNHSATQYPDLSHALVGNKPAEDAVSDRRWIEDVFIPTVQQRGSAIIRARGSSSAASAASAAIDNVRDWTAGTADGTGCRWRCAPTARTGCRRG